MARLSHVALQLLIDPSLALPAHAAARFVVSAEVLRTYAVSMSRNLQVQKMPAGLKAKLWFEKAYDP